MVEHMGRGYGQPRPHPKGAGSKRSPILRFLSIYAYIICRRTTKFDVIIPYNIGRGLFLGGQPSSIQREVGVPPLPNFGVPFYLYTPLDAKLQNLTYGNTYGEGFV